MHMIELTPIGKITIAIIVVLILYFFVLPAVPNPFAPEGEAIERTREIKIVAFLKTFDRNSAKLQETFRELKKDGNLQGLLTLSLINIEAEPGKMEQHNIKTDEVPCFILGNEKFYGWHSTEWFKEKILEISKRSQEKEA